MARTDCPREYSKFNLDALMIMALEARYVGEDIVSCDPGGGGSVADAIAYLLCRVSRLAPQPWPVGQGVRKP